MDAKKIFESMCRLAIKESIGMVQEYAGEHHRFTPRTGNLERSIKIMQQGLVGTVYLDEGQAPYGITIHNGARPRVIVSRTRKALRWAKGGEFIFAKRVDWPGIRPDPFLYEALDAKEGDVVKVFDHYTDLACMEIAQELKRKS